MARLHVVRLRHNDASRVIRPSGDLGCPAYHGLMVFSEQMTKLKKIDGLREVQLHGTKCLIHRDHRWTLVILHWAQALGLAPSPCNLVMFDAHHDSCEPGCAERLDQARRTGLTAEELFDICSGRQHPDDSERLSSLDDDWVQAGMRLGLVGNAVIFGARDSGMNFPLKVEDAVGEDHWIDLLPRPNSALGYQGALGDSIRVNPRAWEILGWEQQGETRWFGDASPPVLFDIDLDYFAIPWSDYLFPWPDEVFEGEFLTPSHQYTTQGKTTRDFFLGLLRRAALLTVSTEPRHCGDGDQEGPKVASILRRLNSYAFALGDSS